MLTFNVYILMLLFIERTACAVLAVLPVLFFKFFSNVPSPHLWDSQSAADGTLLWHAYVRTRLRGRGLVCDLTQAPSLVRTVLQNGARVNTPRGDRRIPLHTAMRLHQGKKKLSIVATLLVVGADIDRPGKTLITPTLAPKG